MVAPYNAVPRGSAWCIMYRDANLANRFAVFLGLKKSILDEKTVFLPNVQYTCVVINLEKKTVFS